MLILMLMAALAAAADTPSTAWIGPDWRRKATGVDMMRVYPQRALRRGISGRALISCSVSKDGRLVDCAVEDESPQGEGFGAAALKLMPLYVMRPATKDGIPVDGGKVRMPIGFATTR